MHALKEEQKWIRKQRTLEFTGNFVSQCDQSQYAGTILYVDDIFNSYKSIFVQLFQPTHHNAIPG